MCLVGVNNNLREKIIFNLLIKYACNQLFNSKFQPQRVIFLFCIHTGIQILTLLPKVRF